MIFLICSILFLAPFSGAMFALKGPKRLFQNVDRVMAFAGGYILSVTFLNLIPEVFESFNPYKGLIVLLGFFFQVFLEKFSEGIEHGHIHSHEHIHAHDTHIKMSKLPLSIVGSLSLHSFIEGIPLGAIGQGAAINWSLLTGIVIHEIPAAFVLLSMLNGFVTQKNSLWFLAVLYACMLPLGFAGSRILKHAISEEIISYFLAFVIGTFLHISTTILFESSNQHLISKRKLTAIVLGVIVAFLSSQIHV